MTTSGYFLAIQPTTKKEAFALDFSKTESLKRMDEINKELADYVKKSVKKLGPKMKWAADNIAAFDNVTINKVTEGEYLLNPAYQAANEEPIFINGEDMEVFTDEIPGFEIANKGRLTVALDITITEELKILEEKILNADEKIAIGWDPSGRALMTSRT